MKAVRALMLVLVLSVCAYAGDMDNGKTGDQGNGGRTAVTYSVTETALQLLQSMSLLF